MSEKIRNSPVQFDLNVLPTQNESEHEISFRASDLIDMVRTVSRHHFARANLIPSSFGLTDAMTDEEAIVAGAQIDKTYMKYFGDQQDSLNRGVTNSWTVAKCDKIIKAIRNTWLENYYGPRTREATIDDFQSWVDSYLDAFGDAALDNLKPHDKNFEDIYRPFAEGSFETKDHLLYPMPLTNLRIATQNLELIKGDRDANFAVIAPSHLSVQQITSRSRQHAIFSIDPALQNYTPKPVLLPSDIN